MNLDTINEILARVERLKPIPALALRIINAAGNPDTPISQIVSLIKMDEILTAKILKRANSVYHKRLAAAVNSIDDAVLNLGFHNIVNIVLAETAGDHLINVGDGYGIARGELWRHSVACAAVAMRLSKLTGFSEVEPLFTSCIVHDIGKSVLDFFIAEKRAEIRGTASIGKASFTKVEIEMLGFDHASIGALILEKWALPESIVSAVRWHHEPENGGDFSELAWHVHISDLICLMVGVGLGVDGLSYEGRMERLSKYGIKEADLQKLLIIAIEELEHADKLLKGE